MTPNLRTKLGLLLRAEVGTSKTEIGYQISAHAVVGRLQLWYYYNKKPFYTPVLLI